MIDVGYIYSIHLFMVDITVDMRTKKKVFIHRVEFDVATTKKRKRRACSTQNRNVVHLKWKGNGIACCVVFHSFLCIEAVLFML